MKVKLSPIGIRNSNTNFRATDGAMALEEIVVTASRIGKSDYDYYPSEPESSFDEIVYEAKLSVDFRIRSEPRTQ